MRVAIDTRIAYNNDKALRMFTWGLWQDIAISQPNHDFFFITNEKRSVKLPPNAHADILKKTKIQWIDERRLRKKIIALKADRVILWQKDGFIVSNNFLQATNKKTAQSGRRIVFGQNTANSSTPNEYELLEPALTNVVTSLTWAEAESIKTQYTGGRSFFLFTGDIDEQHQLIELLKAFSLFKKWQQSNMQLVIAGNSTGSTGDFEEKLITYKYREDVVVLKNLDNNETAKLVAASYLLLYPATGNVFPLALLWAVQSNKAIIATGSQLNRQISDAALWVEENNTADGFAKAMMLLYKDESQQQQLVQRTREEAMNIDRQQMLAAVWRCAEQ